MEKLIALFRLLFTRENPGAVAAGLVDYSGQGRSRSGDGKGGKV